MHHRSVLRVATSASHAPGIVSHNQGGLTLMNYEAGDVVPIVRDTS